MPSTYGGTTEYFNPELSLARLGLSRQTEGGEMQNKEKAILNSDGFKDITLNAIRFSYLPLVFFIDKTTRESAEIFNSLQRQIRTAFMTVGFTKSATILRQTNDYKFCLTGFRNEKTSDGFIQFRIVDSPCTGYFFYRPGISYISDFLKLNKKRLRNNSFVHIVSADI